MNGFKWLPVHSGSVRGARVYTPGVRKGAAAFVKGWMNRQSCEYLIIMYRLMLIYLTR